MNKFITYLAVLLLIASCAHSESNEKAKEVVAPILDVASYDVLSIEDAYNLLVSEKLQDYVEKQKILKKHPEFDTGLVSNPSILTVNDSITRIVVIDNIQTKDFDSIALKTVVSYHSKSQNDTIISKIIRSKVVVEGEQFISSKILFVKTDNQ